MKKSFLLLITVCLLSCGKQESDTTTTIKTYSAKTDAETEQNVIEEVYSSDDGTVSFKVVERMREGNGGIRLFDESTGKTYAMEKVDGGSEQGKGEKYKSQDGMVFWLNGEDFVWGTEDKNIATGKRNRATGSSFEGVYRNDLKLDGMQQTFVVEQKANVVSITPSGLNNGNKPVTVTIDGRIVNSDMADLNGDGNPEVYVFTNSSGKVKIGNVIAYGVTEGKTFTPVFLPDITEDQKAAVGYKGGDQFTISDQALLRKFPVYQAGDPEGKPSGGTRTLVYKLRSGSKGLELYIDRIENVSS